MKILNNNNYYKIHNYKHCKYFYFHHNKIILFFNKTKKEKNRPVFSFNNRFVYKGNHQNCL